MVTKNIWVKKSRRKRVNRIKIATNNVRTLLRDEQIQDMEVEFKETILVWDAIGIGEVRRREECFTTLQSGHLLYHPSANNGKAGVGFLINKRWKDYIMRVNSISPRVAELVLCISKRYKLKIVHLYAPTPSFSEEEKNSFYNDMEETLGKPIHYTIDGRLQCASRETNKPYGSGNRHIWARNEKRKKRRIGRMGNIKKVQNHECHVSEESRKEMDVEKPKRRNKERN
ncbi:MAG: hypothetical protein M3H12_03525 [Chromatiales bacterium]